MPTDAIYGAVFLVYNTGKKVFKGKNDKNLKQICRFVCLMNVRRRKT